MKRASTGQRVGLMPRTCDWSVVRIYPRILRLIGLAVVVKCARRPELGLDTDMWRQYIIGGRLDFPSDKAAY
eukprot:1188452-Prorocentrum_minimum.AAC.2